MVVCLYMYTLFFHGHKEPPGRYHLGMTVEYLVFKLDQKVPGLLGGSNVKGHNSHSSVFPSNQSPEMYSVTRLILPFVQAPLMFVFLYSVLLPYLTLYTISSTPCGLYLFGMLFSFLNKISHLVPNLLNSLGGGTSGMFCFTKNCHSFMNCHSSVATNHVMNDSY